MYDKISKEIPWYKGKYNGNDNSYFMSIHVVLNKFGDIPIFRYPIDKFPDSYLFTNTLEKLLSNILVKINKNINYNHALIKMYKNNFSFKNEYSTKTIDITNFSDIITINLGEKQRLILKIKKQKSRNIILPKGSLFVLGWNTNINFKHYFKPYNNINNDIKANDVNNNTKNNIITITFTSISTFIDKNGNLYGKGNMNKINNIYFRLFKYLLIILLYL